MLRGANPSDLSRPLPPEFRLWQIIKLTGWSKTEIDDTPAGTLDWLLAIERLSMKIQAGG